MDAVETMIGAPECHEIGSGECGAEHSGRSRIVAVHCSDGIETGECEIAIGAAGWTESGEDTAESGNGSGESAVGGGDEDEADLAA